MPSMIDGQRSPIGSLAKLGDGVRANSDSKTQAGLSRGAGQNKKLVNAAWTNTFPAQGATLDLDFANDRGFVRGVGQGRSMDAVTFTRASNGTFVKPDGTLGQHSNQGALGKNLLTFPQDFDNAAWVKFNATITANNEIAPDGTLTADLIIPNAGTSLKYLGQLRTMSSGTAYVTTFYLKSNGHRFIQFIWGGSNTDFVNFDIIGGIVGTVSGSGLSATMVDAGNGWWRCVAVHNPLGASATEVSFCLVDSSTSVRAASSTSVSTVFAWGAQLELGSTATQYFPTNINTPRFDWASTASTGAGTIASPFVIPLLANPTSNGLLIEESRANRLLWCRDATQTNWTKTNVTVAKTQTGVDGVANSASLLTASSANGICIQTITLASGSRTGSVFLKRITGTGTIQVTLDGTTYSTVDLSTSEWRRIVLSGTVTNPTVGIRIVTSGDAVAMDFGQVEDGAFVTTPILTTTASITRSSDIASMPSDMFNIWSDKFRGTFLATTSYLIPNSGIVLGMRAFNQSFNILGSSTEFNTFGLTFNITGSLSNRFNTVTHGASFLYTQEVLVAREGKFLTKSLTASQNAIPQTTFAIGNRGDGNTPMIGCIKRIVYFPIKATESEMLLLTGEAT